jgi:hypothetical protein
LYCPFPFVKILCQPPNSGAKYSIRQNGKCPKKWKFPFFTIFALCKLSLYKQPHEACGKGLWKSLWILWKSICFPQVKQVFPHPLPWFVVHNFLYNSGKHAKKAVLRNQQKMGNQRETSVEKVPKSL